MKSNYIDTTPEQSKLFKMWDPLLFSLDPNSFLLEDTNDKLTTTTETMIDNQDVNGSILDPFTTSLDLATPTVNQDNTNNNMDIMDIPPINESLDWINYSDSQLEDLILDSELAQENNNNNEDSNTKDIESTKNVSFEEIEKYLKNDDFHLLNEKPSEGIFEYDDFLKEQTTILDDYYDQQPEQDQEQQKPPQPIIIEETNVNTNIIQDNTITTLFTFDDDENAIINNDVVANFEVVDDNNYLTNENYNNQFLTFDNNNIKLENLELDYYQFNGEDNFMTNINNNVDEDQSSQKTESSSLKRKSFTEDDDDEEYEQEEEGTEENYYSSDEDYKPTVNVVKKTKTTTTRKTKTNKRQCRMGVKRILDERTKEQNKVAAMRYRVKKREEKDQLEDVYRIESKKNEQLKNEVEELDVQIKVLKELLVNYLPPKKLIFC